MKPEFVKINDKKYKINTDFKVALECNEIAENNSIGEYEKALAIIYKLFGDAGLDDKQNHEKLLELGLKYLVCGEEEQTSDNEEPNMNFEQDKGKIKASFFSDYKVEDIYSRYMHFYDFCDYMNGLTEDCALNRARYIRDYDISDIKDSKERDKWIKMKKSVELKKKEIELTEEQRENVNKFKKLAGLDR